MSVFWKAQKYAGGLVISGERCQLLPDAGIVVEVKKTRPTLVDRGVGSELAEDVTRYSDPAANRGATTLVCFVHDPGRLLVNPVGLERDLALASNERLNVVGIVG
ncbi:hypothetical protein [Mycobacterium sp. BK086]|uniref:PD-(D/E)XK nuclease domain-containing protein n=1 Tax=Mycobacterium sp. BK086 TaxID=2512165 RepID=UPI00105FD01E|nr:hypothetical protein [Mycobacterium sp. BK086]